MRMVRYVCVLDGCMHYRMEAPIYVLEFLCYLLSVAPGVQRTSPRDCGSMVHATCDHGDRWQSLCGDAKRHKGACIGRLRIGRHVRVVRILGNHPLVQLAPGKESAILCHCRRMKRSSISHGNFGATKVLTVDPCRLQPIIFVVLPKLRVCAHARVCIRLCLRESKYARARAGERERASESEKERDNERAHRRERANEGGRARERSNERARVGRERERASAKARARGRGSARAMVRERARARERERADASARRQQAAL